MDFGGDAVFSFSGGVADCIATDKPWLTYGDLGPLLGRAIRESKLCRGVYRLGEETIRATVIGAGCHSAQLSGSTVFYQNAALPLKNLPVTQVSAAAQTDPAALKAALSRQETPGILAIPGWNAPSYAQVSHLADAIASAVTGPCRIALENDMAKALGIALRLRLGEEREILCLDRLRLPDHCYLDVGMPVGPALPVVIKTLVLDS
jgi:ethanolamine utilization protein EutA